MIRINNQDWEMRFVSPTSSILKNPSGEYTLGVTIPEWRKIYIANNIRGPLLKHVIAHELTHAELAARGVFVPVYIEECISDIIADNILEVNDISKELCMYYGKC